MIPLSIIAAGLGCWAASETQLNQLQVVTDTGNIYVGSVLASEYRVISDTGSIKMDIKEGVINAETNTGAITVWFFGVKCWHK